MKLSLTLLITCCILLSGCGSNTIHSTQGYTITYPSGYTTGKDTSNGISLIEKETGTIIVVNKTPIVTEKTNDEIIQWYKGQSTIEASGETDINGEKGAYVEFTNRYGNLAMYHRDIWFKKGGNIYTIACITKEKNKDTVQKTCSEIFSSLQIVQ